MVLKTSHDKWIKCISPDGCLVATAITAGQLVEEARKRHHCGPVEIKALGEALMAGLLLASTCKKGERVSLSIRGDKFLRQAVVDANPSGTVRGFIITRDLASNLDETLGPWQNGLLSVARLKATEKEPYVGAVPNLTGYLAKDVTYYLSQSEQIPSAVGLAVNVENDGRIDSAGAFLVQVLPGATPEEIKAVEDNIHHMHSLASQLTSASDPTSLLGLIFKDIKFTVLEEKPLLYECNCSKDRVSRALKLLGEAELQDMIAEDGGAEINCDFCGTKFQYSSIDLQSLITELKN